MTRSACALQSAATSTLPRARKKTNPGNGEKGELYAPQTNPFSVSLGCLTRPPVHAASRTLTQLVSQKMPWSARAQRRTLEPCPKIFVWGAQIVFFLLLLNKRLFCKVRARRLAPPRTPGFFLPASSIVLTKESHDLVRGDAKELPPRALAVRCEPHMDRTLDCECVYEPERALELVR